MSKKIIAAGTIKRIHVNQHNIRSNGKDAEHRPPLTVKTSKGNDKGHRVVLYHDDVPVAEVLYKPDKPLACGARVWIETRVCEVEIEDEN